MTETTPQIFLKKKKKTAVEKNGDRYGQSMYKLRNNVAYSETMGHLRNRNNIRFVSNKKGYIKWTSKPISKSQKILDNNLFAIR